MIRQNDTNQPIGDPMPERWTPPPFPARRTLEGRVARIEPLDAAKHADDLWEASQHDSTGESWTYMAYGPFADLDEIRAWIEQVSKGNDPLFFAFIDTSTGKSVGWGTFMRIDTSMAVIEVGNIWMSPLLKRTSMATEIMHLMMKQAFDLGYRRYEWKCDALNIPSRRAAERLGFTYEGTFRQAMQYKGRNRDTAWYSIVDHEWPAISSAQAAWLNPANFDDNGQQIQSLSNLIREPGQ
jgi:RimJ/RimL family protein N-acetyltransferase